MKRMIGNNMTVETELPINTVDSFWFTWKPNNHALFELNGSIYGNVRELSHIDKSRIRIWLLENGEEQVFFSGCIVKVKIGARGEIAIEAMSPSCLLDQKPASRSYQDIKLSYGEIVRQTVEDEGGHVMRNREQDKVISTPVIQYEETVWEFAKRLANRSGVYLIPDIVTGKPNLWFGMRKGKEVSSLSEEQYGIEIFPLGKKGQILYRSQGNVFYKIGDYMNYLGQRLMITSVDAHYNYGELIFSYVLEAFESKCQKLDYRVLPAGLGLWGTIRKVKAEKLMIALDIDEGRHTGNYFYPWQPETGNTFYAMPEIGARALLYFYHADTQEGAVIHCSNNKTNDEKYYKNRQLSFLDGNTVQLSQEEVSFSTKENQELFVGNGSVFAETQKALRICASSVWLGGSTISIDSPDEINISQN